MTCPDLVKSCTRSFPVPFTGFPIYIVNDNIKATAGWKELFPEAFVVDLTELDVILANLGSNGILVILASTSTFACRDLFLNIVSACVNISVIKDYHGFFIDDFDITDATQIYELLAPRQQMRTANNRPDFSTRSYWIRNLNGVNKVLEGQLFPALVDRATVPLPTQGPNLVLLGLFIFFFILGLLFWITVLVY